MTAYGPPAPSRPPASPVQRAALLSYVAGGLGVLSFVWGFLKWLTDSTGGGKTKFGAYALASPAVAIIGFSLAAGLLAAAATVEKKPASLTPVGLSVTSLLLVVGVLIGKSSVSARGGSAHVGVGIGLILELITVILQVAVLVFAWVTASGRISANRAPAWPAQPQQPYPGQPGQPGPPQGYGPPQAGTGYGPPPGQ